MDVISIYGYHDASLSIKKNGKYHIYEAERVFNLKTFLRNSMLYVY